MLDWKPFCRVRRFVTTLAAACGLLLLAGCGSESEEGGAPAAETEGGQSSAGGQGASGDLIKTDAGGNKMLVDIPLDVWYDDPLAVVQEAGTVAQNTAPQPTGGDTAPATTDTPPAETPTPEPEPAAATVAWQEIIPMPILDAEVKGIRNALATTLRTVGTYNSGRTDIPPQAITMAALAQIALKHPEQALWKDQAAAMRDLSVNVAANADANGRKPYEATSQEFEKIQLIFNGSTPELEEAPEPDLPFADRVDRGPLMYRIQGAYRWLSSNVPTESTLKENKEKALHEAVILAALVQVTSDHSFLFSDEPDYEKHARETLDAIQQMRQGIEAENYDLFREGVGLLNKKCTECHLQYKDEG